MPPPERELAELLSAEGFSVAVIGADVTYEELEAILPRRKKGQADTDPS